ncbi:S1 family peptidase [Actinophytocola sediminis]
MIRVLALGAVIMLTTGMAPASPEQRAAAITRPAVVSVEVDWRGWVRDSRTGEVFGGQEGYQVTTRCSGVVVTENGYVATAGHCVDAGPSGGGGALVDLALAELATLGRVGDQDEARAQLTTAGVVEGATAGTPVRRDVRVERVIGTSSTPDRDVAPATVVEVLPPGKGDVALLRIPRDGLSSVAVSAEDELPAGTPILAIGYPAAAQEATDPGTEPTNKNGQISTRRTVAGTPHYEISAAASPGMSGGPVVDMSGTVIGLVSAAPKGETQPFNLVTASSTIWQALREHRVMAAPSANDRNFVAGLDRYYAGDYPAAVEYFDAVLAATPTHRQAAEFRRLAADQGTGGPDLLLLLIIGCATVSVLAGVAAALLARQRRRVVADLPTPPYGLRLPVPPPSTPPLPRSQDD